MTLLDRSRQVASIFSLIWWTFTLGRREPAPEPVTQEIIDMILPPGKQLKQPNQSDYFNQSGKVLQIVPAQDIKRRSKQKSQEL
jgi:hypothetical protein